MLMLRCEVVYGPLGLFLTNLFDLELARLSSSLVSRGQAIRLLW